MFPSYKIPFYEALSNLFLSLGSQIISASASPNYHLPLQSDFWLCVPSKILLLRSLLTLFFFEKWMSTFQALSHGLLPCVIMHTRPYMVQYLPTFIFISYHSQGHTLCSSSTKLLQFFIFIRMFSSHLGVCLGWALFSKFTFLHSHSSLSGQPPPIIWDQVRVMSSSDITDAVSRWSLVLSTYLYLLLPYQVMLLSLYVSISATYL